MAIDETRATIDFDVLPVVRGDPLLLTQLFQNLVENAIKFRSSRTPHIRVAAEHRDAGWHIWVSDNGIGIDAADAKRVFGMFERLHARDEYAGSGIGLAICRKIVERHGGRIWTEPAKGTGSSFVFTLPDAS